METKSFIEWIKDPKQTKYLDLFRIDLFNLDFPKEVIPEMTIKDFESTTKKLLNTILNEYNSAWFDRRVKDHEYEKTPCEGCLGNGEFNSDNDVIKTCVQDREEGDCYVREYDHEAFSEAIENYVVNDSKIYDLLNCKLI